MPSGVRSHSSPNIRSSFSRLASAAPNCSNAIAISLSGTFSVISRQADQVLKRCQLIGSASDRSMFLVCLRTCGHSLEYESHFGEIDHHGVARTGLVITRGDASELFKITEKVLQQMASFIQCFIAVDNLCAVRSRRNHRRCSPRRKVLAYPVDVKGLVAKQCTKGKLAGQRRTTPRFHCRPAAIRIPRGL